MYIDDYWLYDNSCLNCLPPSAPINLTVQQIVSPDPQIQVNWQGNYWNQYAFKIIRKNGLPTSSNEYEVIGIVSQGVNQYLDSEISIDSTYTYGVLALNMYGNSDTSNTASITVLPIPVELVLFTIDVINNDVQLDWTTATETNNSGFEILRFAQNNNVWNKLGFVPGHGTTTEPQFYSYTDEEVKPGRYQYRLKQIDFDGSFEYSEIVEVTVEGPTEFSLSQNYPNPFNPTTSLQYAIGKRQFVSLKVYDVLGNEVANLVNEEKLVGEYEVEFNAEGLPTGIYFYQIIAGNYVQTKKMVLLK